MVFQVGPLFVHLYGIIIMLGALAAAFLTAYRANQSGKNPEFVWDALSLILICGVLGDRKSVV